MTAAKEYHLELLSQANYKPFFDLIQNNRSRLEDFFAGTVAKTQSLEATEVYCKELERKIEEKSYFPYLIVENESGSLLGFIDVKNIDWDIPKAELGAFVDSHFEGKGLVFHYVNELVSKIVEEHGFKKLLCRAASQNNRSIRVIKRLGFELEGTIRCDYRTTKGILVDLDYYGKVFNEF